MEAGGGAAAVILDRGVKVHELPLDDILKEFKAGKVKATANDHAFRWRLPPCAGPSTWRRWRRPQPSASHC